MTYAEDIPNCLELVRRATGSSFERRVVLENGNLYLPFMLKYLLFKAQMHDGLR